DDRCGLFPDRAEALEQNQPTPAIQTLETASFRSSGGVGEHLEADHEAAIAPGAGILIVRDHVQGEISRSLVRAPDYRTTVIITVHFTEALFEYLEIALARQHAIREKGKFRFVHLQCLDAQVRLFAQDGESRTEIRPIVFRVQV